MGGLIDPIGGGRLNTNALDLRGAQPLILVVVERDASMTWLAPDNLSDRHLEMVKASFFRWLSDYRKHRQARIQVPPV